MKLYSIKSRLLLAFTVLLTIITLLNALQTSFVMNRRGEEEAFAQLSRRLTIFEQELRDLRKTQISMALDFARDDKNLSDMAILYDQAIKLRQQSETTLERTFFLNKSASLNRLQLILGSAHLSGVAVYLDDTLSHYVDRDKVGMVIRRNGDETIVGTSRKGDENLQLTNMGAWRETELPVLLPHHLPEVDSVMVGFEFPAEALMVLRVIVPVQGILRESFLETIVEHAAVVEPQTRISPQSGDQKPQVIGMMVFSQVFDTDFVRNIADRTGMAPAIFSPDGQFNLQLNEMGNLPPELMSGPAHRFIRTRTISIGGKSYYQAFKMWQINGETALILSSSQSREGTLAMIRQTITTMTGMSVLIFLVVVIAGYLVLTRIVEPITDLTAAVSGIIGLKRSQELDSVTRGKILRLDLKRYLERRIVVQSSDEIGALTSVFNTMAEQLYDLIRNLEARVQERTAQLEKANQAKSVFLANMSHELRTPMNAILGYSQLMQKDARLPSEQREYLNTINRNGEQLLALINEVLAISKIEAGQTTIESTTFDLRAMLGDLEKMFNSSMDSKGLQFEVIGIDAVPQYVATDENKLRQVLVNLLGNAVKFTEQGGVTIRVAVENEVDEKMRLKVEVTDTGVGIAEDELDKVFNYFEQTASGRAQQSGTGLGMAISRDFARMMGGDITVASKEGRGSTFYLNINIQKKIEPAINEKISKARVIGLAPEQKIPRVLVAEDVEAGRTLLVKILKVVGFEVEEAVNGKEAVEKVEQWRPDFIWMDIRMPVMDGLAATRRIKQTGAGQSTIVAALTAHALEEEKERILAAGCDDFVRKPFGEQEIFEVMAKHFDLKYVYEDEPVASDAVAETQAQLTPQQLMALPADLLRRLHDAVVELDNEQILALSEKIKLIDAHVARALETCVKKFALSPLLDLLEEIERPEHEDSND